MRRFGHSSSADATPLRIRCFASCHGAVDKANDGEAGNAALDVHLDVDAARLQADKGMRDRVRAHVATLDDDA